MAMDLNGNAIISKGVSGSALIASAEDIYKIRKRLMSRGKLKLPVFRRFENGAGVLEVA